MLRTAAWPQSMLARSDYTLVELQSIGSPTRLCHSQFKSATQDGGTYTLLTSLHVMMRRGFAVTLKACGHNVSQYSALHDDLLYAIEQSLARQPENEVISSIQCSGAARLSSHLVRVERN